ncbi:intraflagellar transport protein 43 homolog [Diabrotica virgifera virgifera]|uniref:Intraflagellar transport protein 43 homolog n=1 Tax=Diabrotica virgifera virgifera TaxID=50390 RepID=A0ABM5KNX8_DIAVI|nr:intraflagellar transport protein 43 homolog [Diabrotica virgifera virgifera]
MLRDDDIDLLVGKKSAPKQGRRSVKNLEEPEIAEELSKDMDDLHIRARKTSLWSDEPPKSSRSESSGRNMIELERFQNEIKLDADDIPIIPDIEEIQDDTFKDAKSMLSMDESVKDLDKQVNTMRVDPNFKGAKFGDIDLSFLMINLYPEKDVQDCDEVWTLESLYKDLSREREKN